MFLRIKADNDLISAVDGFNGSHRGVSYGRRLVMSLSVIRRLRVDRLHHLTNVHRETMRSMEVVGQYIEARSSSTIKDIQTS